jgi:hypothetical protein
MRPEAERWIQRLRLEPHPEGGWYRETARTPAMTTIYYLLAEGQHSAWHRLVDADEVWHHYAGDPLVLYLLGPDGLRREVLGEGGSHHVLVPAGIWQAATPASVRHGHALVGCTVAPPFAFERFELGDRARLTAEHPEHAPVVARFSR